MKSLSVLFAIAFDRFIEYKNAYDEFQKLSFKKKETLINKLTEARDKWLIALMEYRERKKMIT